MTISPDFVGHFIEDRRPEADLTGRVVQAAREYQDITHQLPTHAYVDPYLLKFEETIQFDGHPIQVCAHPVGRWITWIGKLSGVKPPQRSAERQEAPAERGETS